MTDPQGPVRRRHVFYVPGYDPRTPRIYYMLFRHELGLWAQRNGVRATLSRDKDAEAPGLTTWRLVSEGEGGRVETTFDFLAWEDLADREFRQGHARRLLAAAEVFFASLVEGTFFAMARWNWKFGLFAAYPWAMALGYLMVAVGWTAACLSGAARLLPLWPGLAVGALAAGGGLWGWWRLIRRWEPKTYVFYLMNDWIWTGRHRRWRDPAAATRFEAFAQRIAQVAQAGQADELLVIGHSSGSFVGAIAAVRALELSAGITEATPLNFLTIGANTPISCAAGRDNPGRRAIAGLLAEPRVRWIEYFTPNDVMSFPRLDYRACYRIDLEGRRQLNPIMRSARMSDIFTAETWGRLDWRFFEKHFQFLRANERPGEYDFYRFLAGPGRFGDQLDRPA